MAEEKNIEPNLTLSSTDLAFERTVLAHERTLMAWVRTSTSMISFGFTIYKLLHEVTSKSGEETILTPRLVGMAMIFIGLLGLFLAQIQHYKALKKLRKIYQDVPWSVSFLLATLIIIFGIALFLGALFKQ